jgi:hypothetical protein
MSELSTVAARSAVVVRNHFEFAAKINWKTRRETLYAVVIFSGTHRGNVSMRLRWDILCAFVWDNDALVMSLGRLD